jgi:hypothetical protein
VVKTRTVRRSRLVPHEVDGEEELVLDRYDVEVPLPPRDWDRLVLSAVTAGAGLLVTVSVIWSTASIGDLLARVVIAPAAYGAAVAFDVTWILCMAVEWLARYDQSRATLPRVAGHLSLLIAMGAVAAHGSLFGQPIIGAVGAVVSGLAKGSWTIVMRFHARPLDDRTQQWVDKRRGALSGQLAMIPIRRELLRAKGLVDAEAAALGQTDPVRPENPEANPDRPDSTPDLPDGTVLPLKGGPMSIADAVRTAADCGIHDPDAVLRYVRKVADPAAKTETVARYVRDLRRSAS